MIRIACDTHSHTLLSRHAFSTIQENVHAAAIARLELLGCTDHFSSMITKEVNLERAQTYDLRDFQHFINYSAWPSSWEGVRVLHGCEVDIVDMEGHIFGEDIPVRYQIGGRLYDHVESLADKVCSQCDYALASLHNVDFARQASKSEVTRMYMKALDNPYVLILGHTGRYGVDFDIKELCAYAKEKGKLIEINEATLAGYPTNTCKEIALCCAETETMIATGSDSHISMHIGQFSHVKELLEEIHFPQKLIATTDSATFLRVMHHALGTQEPTNNQSSYALVTAQAQGLQDNGHFHISRYKWHLR